MMILAYMAILAAGAVLWGTLLSPLLGWIVSLRSGTPSLLWHNWLLCFICGFGWMKFFPVPKKCRAVWMFFLPLIGVPFGLLLGTIRGILVPPPT